MDVRFAIVSPPRKKGSLNVKLPILIGRAEEAKFRIQQDSVSRRHCEVFIKEGSVFVRDLGSTNGTFLDGEQVTAAVASLVKPGSEIRIGGVVFRVEYQPVAAMVAADDDTASLETVPMDQPPPAGDSPAEEMAEAEPLAEAVDVEEAAEPRVDDSPADAALTAESLEAAVDMASEEPAGTAGFPMLEPAAEASAESDDDNLNDFFKSLK
jgi:predicted component of type VI protein secretion system